MYTLIKLQKSFCNLNLETMKTISNIFQVYLSSRGRTLCDLYSTRYSHSQSDLQYQSRMILQRKREQWEKEGQREDGPASFHEGNLRSSAPSPDLREFSGGREDEPGRRTAMKKSMDVNPSVKTDRIEGLPIEKLRESLSPVTHDDSLTSSQRPATRQLHRILP